MNIMYVSERIPYAWTFAVTTCVHTQQYHHVGDVAMSVQCCGVAHQCPRITTTSVFQSSPPRANPRLRISSPSPTACQWYAIPMFTLQPYVSVLCLKCLPCAMTVFPAHTTRLQYCCQTCHSVLRRFPNTTHRSYVQHTHHGSSL